MEKTNQLVVRLEKKARKLQRRKERISRSIPLVKPCYCRAGKTWRAVGDLYALLSEWILAAKAFSQAADCLAICRHNEETVPILHVRAAYCFRKVQAADAFESLSRALEHCLARRQFDKAGKIYLGMARLHEFELENAEKAAEYYLQAANFMRGHTMHTLKDAYYPCLFSAARIYARAGQYFKAIELYNQVVQDNDKAAAQHRNFAIILVSFCHLCLKDIEGLMRTLSRYENSLSWFQSSSEKDALKDISRAIESRDLSSLNAYIDVHRDVLYKELIVLTLIQRVQASLREEGFLDLQ